ncbi:serpin-ZX [Rosa chinensis]|uniref:serpin-ZX n=1 Tax=Rosa chinensis TaxID=74649 RepID=UPI000D089AD4|nr:serpin-ZX [Rosa chinensis]
MDYKDLKALRKPISNQTDVALKITKQLLESEFKDKNLIFSPLSIHIVLSLIAARTNNPQFLSFLKSKSIDDLNSLAFNLITSVLADSPSRGGPRLNATNGLWVDESIPLEDSYKQVVLDSYKAALNQVDFKTDPEQVRIQVNSWVDKETRGLIPEILPPGSVGSGMCLIFANALDCALEDFDNGTYADDPRYFSMLWLLPDARDGLPALTERVCSESRFLDRHLNSFTTVRVKKFLIPKFKISSGFEASGVLKKIGLGDGCDLMAIFHESVIDVDENGTTAAAATCAETWDCDGDFSKPKEIDEFVADHPFMFLIRENRTRTVLFMGQVLNPLSG